MATIELPVADVPEPAAPSEPVRFHLSLNVANLDASIAFYRILFGVEPAKCYADYAKFEMTDPPVVLSLEPQPHAMGGALNHLGFRLGTTQALVESQRRLETAGIRTNREEGVECCYARQTKFWVKDPDANLWEMYVVEADVEHRGARPPDSGAAKEHHHGSIAAPATRTDLTWEHQLGQPFPAKIPLADGSADQILLRGTFNVPMPIEERERVLHEARRVLRSGGRIVFHGLVADSALTSTPNLPGPAEAVSHVPTTAEILEAIRKAGFAGLRLQKLSSSPVFHHESIVLRELLLEARKSEPSPFDLSQRVLYKGPLAEVSDDLGTIYRRGEMIRVPSQAAELLREGSLAEAFVFIGP